MTGFPIRPIREDEFDAFRAVDEHAWHDPPATADERTAMLARFEFDRSLAAFDGRTLVGTAAAFSFRMRVPGAVVPVAGVTWVAVLPSHRRRGILTALMRRQLVDVGDRGEPVAVLHASEAGIYGRFGYGPASAHATYTIHRGEGTLTPEAPNDPSLRLRIVDPADARPGLAAVYDAAASIRPGFVARSQPWWDRVLRDPSDARGGTGPLRVLFAEDANGPRGYALYHGRDRFEERHGLPDHRLTVREAVTVDPAATAAIWRDLLSRDLVAVVEAGMRPVDDPLRHLLADPRRLRATVVDGLWLRVIDVPAALSARRYACPVEVVVEVIDGLLPGNTGRWRLCADRDGASCTRTMAEPDLTLGVAALGAAYLGGVRLGALAGAGRVTERQPGALAALSAALSWDPAPWCPMVF